MFFVVTIHIVNFSSVRTYATNYLKLFFIEGALTNFFLKVPLDQFQVQLEKSHEFFSIRKLKVELSLNQ